MSHARLNLSLFESLPLDIRILIVTSNSVLSLVDICALASTSKANNAMFNGRRANYFWSRLSHRDFGCAANSKSAYQTNLEFERERERIIAYTQILMSTDERAVLEPVEFISRRQDRHELNPENYLSRQLLLRQYNSFVSNASSILLSMSGDENSHTRQQARLAIVNEGFDALFKAEPAQTRDALMMAMDCMNDIINEDGLHLPQDLSGTMATLLSVLGKCGAYHTMTRLFDKLDPDTLQNLIELAGVNLCRDAAMYGHANIVDLLCRGRAGVAGVPVNEPASHCLLFDEFELLLLPSALKSMESLLAMRELRLMIPAMRHSLLNAFASVLQTLMHHGANAELVRQGYGVGFLGMQVLIAGDSFDYVRDILRKLPACLIQQDELAVIYDMLAYINSFANHEIEERDDSSHRKVARHEFDDDYSDHDDDEDSDLKSPAKKTRTSDNENEDVEFMASPPEAMEMDDDPQIESPARKFGRLGLGD